MWQENKPYFVLNYSILKHFLLDFFFLEKDVFFLSIDAINKVVNNELRCEKLCLHYVIGDGQHLL